MGGYTTSQDGMTITNTIETKRISVSGQKTWVDDDDALGLRPTEITVILLQNGEVFEEKTVTEADGWHYSFTELPEFDPNTGDLYEYTIKERMVTGYYSDVDGFDLVNTLLIIDVPDPENPDSELPPYLMPPGFSILRLTEEQLENLIELFEYGVPLWGALLKTGVETPAYPFVSAGVGLAALVALLAGSRKRRKSSR